MRFAVVRVRADGYRFLWSQHHLLSDGWSLPLLLKELFALYEAHRRGVTLELPPPRPFRDYIEWLEKQDQRQAQAFWRRKLAGFEEPTRLGIDAGIAERETTYAEERLTLSPGQMRKLEAFARERRLTPNTLIQGAWALLLGRYSGQQDLVFGEVVAGRSAPLAGIESIVGPLINTLPVRVRLDAEKPVLAWLEELQQRSAETRQYEYSTLVKIQKESEIPPGAPLFEYLYVFENYPLDPSVAATAGLSLELQELAGIEQVNYPLTLIVVPQNQLTLRLWFATSRFEERLARPLLRRLERILDEIVSHPNLAISQIPLLDARERHQLLVEWNPAAGGDEPGRSVVELFERQVASTPDAVALVGGAESVVYADLNRRCNQLAHYLQELGVGEETLVGVCAERSIEMVVALLAVLKAGGAYVPLDADYPAERLAFMLQDTGLEVLLTQSGLSNRLPAHQARVVRLDEDWPEIARRSPANLRSRATPENVAYVIYTSGSTGRPKGVVLRHAGLQHLASRQAEAFGIDAGQRVLQFASLAFDASVSEIFTTLIRGATLCLES
jgi:non-ribosomal peptide synthetase component F